MNEPDRLRRLCRLALAAWLAVLTALLLAPSVALPPDPGFGDKSLHAAAYALAGGLAVLAVRRAHVRALALGLIAFHGVGIELAQALVPSRHADADDVVANLGGLALGTAAAWLLAAARRHA